MLSNLDKTLEKQVESRVYDFLDKSKLIYSLQFGFCEQYSTSHAILHMMKIITKDLDDGSIACGRFVDLQKAFDTVDHNIFLSKFSHYGIRGKTYRWYESYISERKRFLSINGFDSDMSTIKCGLPQGSALAPLNN